MLFALPSRGAGGWGRLSPATAPPLHPPAVDVLRRAPFARVLAHARRAPPNTRLHGKEPQGHQQTGE